jgi:hypothetical protein
MTTLLSPGARMPAPIPQKEKMSLGCHPYHRPSLRGVMALHDVSCLA